MQGQHQEHQTRSVRRIDDRGHARWETETESVTVHDFDFHVDVSQYILHRPTQWSIPDEEPAYRGAMKLEVDGVLMPSRYSAAGSVMLEEERGHGRGYGARDGDAQAEALLWQDEESEIARRRRWKASRQERKRAETWRKEREMRGLPPWIGLPVPVGMPLGSSTRHATANVVGSPVQPDMYENDVMKSTKTVREWADEFCASDKMLKEFTYKKVRVSSLCSNIRACPDRRAYTQVIYGWNFSALEAAVVAAVKSTHYNGRLTVQFVRRGDRVHVRANNWLSRTLSNKWLVVVLWITLLYPFVWLFKQFYHGGGGKWEVCGGAYALKSWRLVDYQNTSNPPSLANPNLHSAMDAPPPPFPGTQQLNSKTLVNTQMGVAEVVGVREGEWFQMWEGTIKRAVIGRLKSQVPLMVPDEGPLPAAMMLDGYQSRPLVSF